MKNLKAIVAATSIGAVCIAAILFGQDKPVALETNPARNLVLAPSWQLRDVDGNIVRSSDFKGKVVILDFWATWCGPCRMEIPSFIELQKLHEKQGVAVIGVSVDQIGPVGVKKFAQQLGVIWSPCAGPTLGSAIGLVTQAATLFQGWALMFAFGVGASLPLLVVAYSSRSLFQAKRNRLAAVSAKAKPLFGIILIFVALGILSGSDKKLETALLRHLPESWIDSTTRF